MADTTRLSAGTADGAVIGTDEVTIGGTLQHVQRMKLVDGADGGTALIGGDATNGLDVDVTRVTGTVTVAMTAQGGVDLMDVTVNNAAGAGSIPVQGADAIDAALTRIPVVIAGRASTATPTGMSADNDVQALWLTLNGAANVADGGGSLTVDGTFWQATQPVSGTFWQATQPVSGTFWQATQPVSGPLTDTQLRAATVPVSGTVAVTGTFWQATQPVSGTLTGVTTVTTVSTVTAVTDVTNPVKVVGNVAADAAYAGSPLLLGGYGSTATPTAMSADGDVTRLWTTLTGALNVADGGGSLTIDGTVAVSGTVTVASHAVTNAGTFVTQENGAALTALQLIDNLVLAEDAVHGSGDPGAMLLAVRRDADTSLVDATGDYAPLQVNAAGSLKVAITAGAGSGGTSLADNAGFTPGTTSFTPIGGEVDDTGTSAASENSGAAVRITAQRAFHVNLRDNTGAEVSVGGGTQYDEDTVSAAAEKLTMAGVVRKDTAATQVDTDGDRTTLIVDSTGRLHANVSNTLTVSSHAVTNAGTFAVQAAQSGTWNIGTVTTVTGVTTVSTVTAVTDITNNVKVVGPAAHDAVNSGAPVRLAGYASAAAPADVSADGDVVNLWALRNGAQATVLTAAGALVGGDATNGLDVDVTRVSGTVTVAGSLTTVSTVTAVTDITNSVKVIGNVAADAVFSGAPVLLGAYGSTATPTAMSADGDVTRLWTTLNGALNIADAGGSITVDGTVAVSGTVTVGSHAVTNAGTFVVQENGTQVQVDDAAFTPATSKIMMAGFEADETSTDSVDEGDGGAARMTLDRKVIVAQYAHTAGGWTAAKLVSAASTNATSLKGSAGQLGFVTAVNVNAAIRYLKFYNKASAPTVGTDVPVLIFGIPGNAAGAGIAINLGTGAEFTTGIAYALTTGAADADTGAVAANEIVLSLGYR